MPVVPLSYCLSYHSGSTNLFLSFPIWYRVCMHILNFIAGHARKNPSPLSSSLSCKLRGCCVCVFSASVYVFPHSYHYHVIRILGSSCLCYLICNFVNFFYFDLYMPYTKLGFRAVQWHGFIHLTIWYDDI